MKKYFAFSFLVVFTLLMAGCSTPETPASSLVGSDAPDFNLENALGGNTSLSEYAGTPVLLFFHMAVG